MCVIEHINFLSTVSAEEMNGLKRYNINASLLLSDSSHAPLTCRQWKDSPKSVHQSPWIVKVISL